MKRALSLLLALFLALGSPALALEPPAPRFDDVDLGAWYAPYVETCVADGLMVGVGDGNFAPEKSLSSVESAVLALRLYDLLHGGDGVFDPAPEDWGYAVFTLPDGRTVQGYMEDEGVWDWARFSMADDGHLCFRLETEEERAWGKSMDYQRAVFSMNGVDCPGELHLNRDSTLYFEPAADSRDRFRDFKTVGNYPAPGPWYRDAWYYADQKGLRELTEYGGARLGFFGAIDYVVEELEPINDIFALPDTAAPSTLRLCRAGVLTGTDEHGAASPDGALTRAQAAAILCRVLHPELRVNYTVQPLETYENYTLTYLCDTREDFPIVGEYLVAIEGNKLLTLDGEIVPTPEGWEIERVGAQTVCIRDAISAYAVMDAQGNVTPAEWWEARVRPGELSDRTALINGYRSGYRQTCFWNAQGEQVTPTFSWTGVVSPDGRSFVCQDGKVYLIQFER